MEIKFRIRDRLNRNKGDNQREAGHRTDLLRTVLSTDRPTTSSDQKIVQSGRFRGPLPQKKVSMMPSDRIEISDDTKITFLQTFFSHLFFDFVSPRPPNLL